MAAKLRLPALRIEHRLRCAFAALGYRVADHARPIVALCVLVVALTSLGAVRFRVDMSIKNDFRPAEARGGGEERAMAQFYSRDGFLFYFTCYLKARDGGSLLRERHRRQLLATVSHMEYNITVPVTNALGAVANMSYRDMCTSTCSLNRPTNVLLKLYKENGTNNNEELEATYPTIKAISNYLYVADHVYDVTTDEQGIITSMGVYKLIFRTIVPKGHMVDRVNELEVRIGDYLRDIHNDDSHLLYAVYGGHYISSLSTLDVGKKATMFLPFGLALTLFYMMYSSARFGATSDPRDSKPYTAAIGLLVPLMAIGITYGSMFALGTPYKVFLATAPFLILAIGVDDVFIVLHAWRRTKKHGCARERISATMADAGPTITLTSLTNLLSMLCGSLNSTPVVSHFCLVTGMGVLVNWIYQVLFYTAVLYLSDARDKKRFCGNPCSLFGGETTEPDTPPNGKSDTNTTDSKLSDLSESSPKYFAGVRILAHRLTSKLSSEDGSIRGGLLKYYCQWACSWWARACALAAVAAYLAGAVYGITKLRVELNQGRITLDPILTEFAELSMHLEYYQAATVFVLVNEPGDLRNRTHLNRTEELVRWFERDTLPAIPEHTIGPDSTLFWLRDYRAFLEGHNRVDANGEAVFSYDLLPAFLSTPPRRWRHFVHAAPAECRRNSPRCIGAYAFCTGFRRVDGWSRLVTLLHHWRHKVDQYADLRATVYEDFAVYADQVHSLPGNTALTVGCALGAMFCVCCIFIRSLWPVVATMAALCSVIFGVLGYMSLFDIQLDGLSLCAVIILVGYSVDFAAHIPYHYYRDARAESTWERLHVALQSIGGPMVQAGVTTILAITGLVFVNCYATDVFLYLQPFTVLLGWFHGLFVLPIALAAFAPVRVKPSSSPVAKGAGAAGDKTAVVK